MGGRGKCLARAKALTTEGEGERNNLSHLAKDAGRPGTFLPSAGELKKKIFSFKVLEPCGSFCLHLWMNKYGPSPLSATGVR